ncbi:MAG: methyl-accepting chemotaxis protein, partial [Acidovorax sp.]
EASTEQSTQIGQVSQAVDQLDHLTQQNAALVEEGAAAAQMEPGDVFEISTPGGGGFGECVAAE